MSESSWTLHPGDPVGPWVVEGEVGRGGAGLVYRATHGTETGRVAAIKIPTPALASEELLAAFEGEREAMSRLDHPGIARIYGSGTTTAGAPWIAMEWIDGVDVLRHAEIRVLELDDRLTLFAAFVEALQTAHRRGIVHGDVRPENLRVVGDGTALPKWVDFGLSGDAAVMDVRDDVRGLAEIADALLPAELWPRRSRADRALVLTRSTAADPESRHATPGALLADLRAAREGRPVSTRSPTLPYLASRWMLRNRAAVAGGLVVLLAAAGALAVSARAWAETRSALAEAEDRLAALLLLADQQRLDDLRSEARFLPPPEPAARDAYETWSAAATELLGRLPLHRASVGTEEDPDGRSDEARLRWRVETRASLVAALDTFALDDPLRSERADVVGRLERLAEAEASLSTPEGRAAWDEARTAIRASAVYRGLDLEPQPGLVPLGVDSVTGLWHFWHVASGPRPTPNERAGRGWKVWGGEGMVFVLLPGGTVQRGSQSTDPDDPFFDPLAQPDEGPIQSVELDPFFVAAHEMTLGQWITVERWDPHHSDPGRVQIGAPVTRVTWSEASEALERVGLGLPTEVQWEYAARGGTDTPWWTGADPESLRGRVNIESGRWAYVGLTEPNAFGLYDVTGNAWEWTGDAYGPYAGGSTVQPSLGPRPGDGRNQVLDAGSRTIRGGGLTQGPRLNRIANRSPGTPNERPSLVGVRAVRPLRPGTTP